MKKLFMIRRTMGGAGESEKVWYVVWTRTGREEEVQRLCRKKIKDKEAFEECFVPKYEKAWKENGKWGKRETILFPGYLFFITDHTDRLFDELKKIPEITKILGDGETPIPLYQHEVDFLQKYTNQEHILEMSTGDLIGGQLIITDGPLKDYRGKVIHIDRRKREATLEMEFFGRTTTMKVGLEVVRKV